MRKLALIGPVVSEEKIFEMFSLHESLENLFVLRFYGPVNPMGHVERGQFT